MVESRWIKMSLFLMLLLHFTAVAEQLYPRIVVRVGDEVTLPCDNVRDYQDKCQRTSWLFVGSGNTKSIYLIERRQIFENAETKSDRLSVAANCSLVIKKVTVEDVGQYTCRQFKSGQQKGPDSQVHLFVITMTEHKDSDKVTLSCSVSTDRRCEHRVKWLYQGEDLDKDNEDRDTSEPKCSVTVTFPTSDLNLKSEHRELFKCEVTDLFVQPEQQFTFSLQSSGQKPGKDMYAATTRSTYISTTAPTTTTTSSTTTTTTTTTTSTTTAETRTDWSVLNYIMLVMRVAELLLITVITVLLIRARGNQRPPDDSTVLNSEGSRAVRRSGPAASQVNNDEDEDDGVVKYETFGETSASVRLH